MVMVVLLAQFEGRVHQPPVVFTVYFSDRGEMRLSCGHTCRGPYVFWLRHYFPRAGRFPRRVSNRRHHLRLWSRCNDGQGHTSVQGLSQISRGESLFRGRSITL
jgi:hypothetical protein